MSHSIPFIRTLPFQDAGEVAGLAGVPDMAQLSLVRYTPWIFIERYVHPPLGSSILVEFRV